MNTFTKEVKEYLESKKIAVTRTEESGESSSVFHVSEADRKKAEEMKNQIEKDLDAYTAYSDSFGMSVIIVEREEE